jgi:hypothetical protein
MGGGRSDGGSAPTDSFAPCGTIPYPPELGNRFQGIMSLSMSQDGAKLASLADDLVFWDVVTPFEASRATPAWPTGGERPRVDISPDGRFVAVSGDAWYVTRALPEFRILSDFSDAGDLPCPFTQARFSPDGRWLAGTTFGGNIAILAVSDLEAGGASAVFMLDGLCDSLAFSPDGSVLATSSGARYETESFTPLSRDVSRGPEKLQHFRDSMEIAVDGSALVSTCSYDGDTGYSCLGYEAPFPKFSPNGQWVLAGGTLRHRWSGETVVLDATASVGIFAANGDVIAAGADYSLTRYCRSER